MTKYYDVVLTNKKHNTKVSYLADSFSVNNDRILKIYSKEYGDVFVEIENDDELSIEEIELKDEYDSMDIPVFYSNRPIDDIYSEVISDAINEHFTKILSFINTNNRGNCDYFIVDQIENYIFEQLKESKE